MCKCTLKTWYLADSHAKIIFCIKSFVSQLFLFHTNCFFVWFFSENEGSVLLLIECMGNTNTSSFINVY